VQEAINKANVLVEALPYIRNYYGKIVVIKLGGRSWTTRRPNARCFTTSSS